MARAAARWSRGSNRSVLYSRRARQPSAALGQDELQVELRRSPLLRLQAASSASPASSRRGAAGAFCRRSITWNSGVRPGRARAAAPRRAARRAGPGGRRRRGAVSRTRRSSSRKVGSPDRSVRSDQGVDEEADEPLELGAVAAGDRACRRRCRPGPCSGESSAEGGQQDHERAWRPRCRPGPSSGSEQRPRHGERGARVAAERLRRPGAAGRSAARGRRSARELLRASRRAAARGARPASHSRCHTAKSAYWIGSSGSGEGLAAGEGRVERGQLARRARPSTSRRRRCGAWSAASTCSLGAAGSSAARTAARAARSKAARPPRAASCARRAPRSAPAGAEVDQGQGAGRRRGSDAPGRAGRHRGAKVVRSASWRATTSARARWQRGRRRGRRCSRTAPGML